MYKGEPTEGIRFYNLLVASEDFTSELGKVALASGRLEAELIQFLKQKGIIGKYERATLGSLVDIAEKNDLLDKNMVIARNTSKQRNYITHNIYALFTGTIDETGLERDNHLDTDILLYIDRAFELKENLEGLADIIRNKEK